MKASPRKLSAKADSVDMEDDEPFVFDVDKSSAKGSSFVDQELHRNSSTMSDSPQGSGPNS